MQWLEKILKKIEGLPWRGSSGFKPRDSKCGGISTLCGVGGYGAYGHQD